MDYALAKLEAQTGQLEEEVHQRTKELDEEKRRADQLLFRMLPK